MGSGVLGLLIGSFLNVVIHRVPARESVVSPSSHCPVCDHPLAPRDNIPILSWALLGGRCRHCDSPISVRYPLIEAATAGLFVAVAVRFGAAAELPAFLTLAAVLLAVSVIDLEHYIVPNRIVIAALVIAVPLLFVASIAHDDLWTFWRSLAAAVGAAASLFVIHLVSPRGMGMGDVKLALVLGLHLGWLSVGHVLLGLFLGFLLGSVVGLALIVLTSRSRKSAVPFAPFLAAGTMLAVLFGNGLIDLYRGT